VSNKSLESGLNRAFKATRRVYLVIRQVATDELRIVPVKPDYKPEPDPAYTWGGPFRSKQAAQKALDQKSSTLRKQLYQPCDSVSDNE
jgi:hypothetical protein